MIRNSSLNNLYCYFVVQMIKQVILRRLLSPGQKVIAIAHFILLKMQGTTQIKIIRTWLIS